MSPMRDLMRSKTFWIGSLGAVILGIIIGQWMFTDLRRSKTIEMPPPGVLIQEEQAGVIQEDSVTVIEIVGSAASDGPENPSPGEEGVDPLPPDTDAPEGDYGRREMMEQRQVIEVQNRRVDDLNRDLNELEEKLRKRQERIDRQQGRADRLEERIERKAEQSQD